MPVSDMLSQKVSLEYVSHIWLLRAIAGMATCCMMVQAGVKDLHVNADVLKSIYSY